MWRSIGRNNSDRGPSSSFRKGMRGGRYDTVGDTPSVRHFSSEQPVLRNVHLVDHPGATRNRSGRWKEDIPFPSSEDVHPSEFRSKKLDDNACLVLPAKGKERKGKARRGEAEITRPPGTGRVMDRGAKKRTPLLLSSSVSFSVYEMVARRRDRSRRAPERRDAACTNRSCVRTSTPALKPPFYRLYFSSDPTPLVRKGLHSSLPPLSPLSSRFFYSPLGVIKVSIRSIRKIRFFTPHACRVRFVSF